MNILAYTHGGDSMSVGFIFWILYLISLVFSLVGGWPRGDGKWSWGFGGSLLVMVLILLLGIRTFGWPISG